MPPKTTPGDINFNKVITELRVLHKEHPTMRFGALVQMARDTKKHRSNFNLNDVSSKELLASVKDYRQKIKNDKKKEWYHGNKQRHWVS